MAFPLMLVIWVASAIATYLLRPKPKIENQKPAALGDFSIPTATEGRPVPIIWGRNRIQGPNVVWYGDYYVTTLKQKVKTGIFSSKDQVIGFRYHLGLQLGLCRGPVDAFLRMWVDDEVVYNSTISGAGSFEVKNPLFFGGEGNGTSNRGGLYLYMRFLTGSEAQATNPYLAIQQTPAPAYRGTCYIVSERGHTYTGSGGLINKTVESGWVGNSPSVSAWAFELERYPNGLAITLGKHIIGQGSNPMAVLYECLTNDEWGLNQSASKIDSAGLRSVAATLFTEQVSFRYIWDRVSDVYEVISEIERLCDGYLYRDPVTGKYSFKLARNDYTLAALDLLDEQNVQKLVNFSRPTWAETTNILSIQFSDPRKNYQDSYAVAQDMANQKIIGRANDSILNFPSCKDSALANRLAWRELRQISYPAARGTIQVDRSQYGIIPGDVRRWSNEKLGIVEMPIRIVKADYGEVFENIITLDFVEDVYQVEPGAFEAPPDTSWAPIELLPEPLQSQYQVATDAPFIMISQDDTAPTTYPRILTFAYADTGAAIKYTVRARTASSSGTQTGAYSQITDAPNSGFYPPATLRSSLGGLASGMAADGTEDINLDPVPGWGYIADLIQEFTSDDMNLFGHGLVILEPGTVNEEWIICQSIVASGAGIQLVNCYRGALDTPILAHSAGTKVWFAWVGGMGLSDILADPGYFYQLKFIPASPTEEVAEADAIPFEIATSTVRYGRPLIPKELYINGSRMPSSAVSTFDTGGGIQGFKFSYTRRQWRTTGALAQVQGKDTNLTSTFVSPSVDALQYRWWLYDLITTPSPSGRGDAFMNGVVSAGDDNFVITRADIITAKGSIPASMRIEIDAIHSPGGGIPSSTVSRSQLIFSFSAT